MSKIKRIPYRLCNELNYKINIVETTTIMSMMICKSFFNFQRMNNVKTYKCESTAYLINYNKKIFVIVYSYVILANVL